jgi:hypothetical protein
VTLQTYVPDVLCCVDGGKSGHVKRAQTGSEDPHRREHKLLFVSMIFKFRSN